MSPIGRVFIVLNLVLAAGFAVLGGQLLQNQHNYKAQLAESEAGRKADAETAASTISQLELERTKFEVASTTSQTGLDDARRQIANLQDDNKRLSQLTSDQAADLKKAVSLQEAANTDAKAAFKASQEAYNNSIAAIKEKDEAVRARDDAQGENRDLKNTIASLNGTIGEKDQMIASLNRDNSENKLLIAAAEANGFIRSMAAPSLAGTVTNASGRLCTIAVGENPGNVDIQSVINRMPFSFAIYDDNGYKCDAVATKYEASANAVLCTLKFTKGETVIKTGDKASTKP
jgi:hypothetical protein